MYKSRHIHCKHRVHFIEYIRCKNSCSKYSWISVLLKPKVIFQGLQALEPKQKLHEDRTVIQYFLVIFMSKLKCYGNKYDTILQQQTHKIVIHSFFLIVKSFLYLLSQCRDKNDCNDGPFKAW